MSVSALGARCEPQRGAAPIDRRLAVAPMMDCTDRHERYLLRIISRHTLLYTEMITTAALSYGDTDRWLAYHASEHPLALQLGPSDLKSGFTITSSTKVVGSPWPSVAATWMRHGAPSRASRS